MPNEKNLYTGRKVEMAAWAQRQHAPLTDDERRKLFGMQFAGATIADYKRAFGIVEEEPGDDRPVWIEPGESD